MSAEYHPSHKTRFSFDASSYDDICVYCGATDGPFGGRSLQEPCPDAPEPIKTELAKLDRGSGI